MFPPRAPPSARCMAQPSLASRRAKPGSGPRPQCGASCTAGATVRAGVRRPAGISSGCCFRARLRGRVSVRTCPPCRSRATSRTVWSRLEEFVTWSNWRTWPTRALRRTGRHTRRRLPFVDHFTAVLNRMSASTGFSLVKRDKGARERLAAVLVVLEAAPVHRAVTVVLGRPGCLAFVLCGRVRLILDPTPVDRSSSIGSERFGRPGQRDRDRFGCGCADPPFSWFSASRSTRSTPGRSYRTLRPPRSPTGCGGVGGIGCAEQHA